MPTQSTRESTKSKPSGTVVSKALRKNITISPEILDRAAAIMKLRAVSEFSELLTVLIREEYERKEARIAAAASDKRRRSLPPVKLPPESEEIVSDVTTQLAKTIAKKRTAQQQRK